MKKIINFIAFVIVSTGLFAQKWNGYTLYSNMNSTSAYLMDTFQATYHTWSGLAQTNYSSFLEPGGNLVRSVKLNGVSFVGGPIGGKIQKHDYAGNLIWDFTYSTVDYCQHHDICPMPNGNVLLISYERKSAAEVSAAGGNNAIEMWPDKIVEVQPTGLTTGNIVWEWKAWDHLMQNVDNTKSNYVTSLVNNPGLLNINYKQTKDWMHMNGVDYNPILDQVAFSSHNLNEIYIIDHSTTTAEAASHTGGNSGKGGDILYRWGSPQAYGASGADIINVTHDAHWIKEGVPNAGRLSCVNNKGMSGPNTTTFDNVITPINGYNYDIVTGQAYAPASYTSRIVGQGYTSNMGSSEELPNGNTLLCLATTGKIYEVDPNGNTLWTKNVSSPQAHIYNSCYISNPAPAIPTITAAGNILSSTAATTYQWYLNGVLISGATSQTYNAVASGVYVVRITDVNGCVYQYSKGLKHNYIPDAIKENNLNEKISIFPNPTNGKINIKNVELLGANYIVSVYNQMGQLLSNFSNQKEITLNKLPNGNYIISISSEKGKATKTITINN
ncbi:MAG: aryl-sulfate sulfotransferase [Chitinophagaceae bacterium]|nr:aryl-sulfate sulfotransferase [Chitinophagaceae bacterium]